MPITVKELKCTYNAGLPTEITALDGVSLQAERGEIISIVGQTGSGKSTLAQHLNALIVPQSGEVIVDGLNPAERSENLRRIREKVGLVFQYPEQQIFSETVEDELSFGPINWGVDKSEIHDRVISAMSVMGLSEDILKKNPFTLSGGQKRRVAIASILASKPDYIVLDEPTAGLDASGTEELIEVLKVSAKNGVGVVHITHDLELALTISDKILILEHGKSISWGTPEETARALCFGKPDSLALPDVLMLSKILYEAGKISGVEWEPYRLAEMVARGC